MLKYFAIKGRAKDDDLWRIFIILKATTHKEAEHLLCQFIKSHQKGCPYKAYVIDDITAYEFGKFANSEGIRAFVANSATEYTKTKREMLIGAP